MENGTSAASVARISRCSILAPLLTAPRILYPAQRGYSQSRYDYLLSVLNLKRQAGRLAADDLADIDALLVPASAEPGGAALTPVPASAPAMR